MPSRYEEDTELDAPDQRTREILLTGVRSSKDAKRLAQRMSVEDSLGLGNRDPNSVRYGLPDMGTDPSQRTGSVDPGFVRNMPRGQRSIDPGMVRDGPMLPEPTPEKPTHGDALRNSGGGVWSGPRGGNQAFEDQMQGQGDYMRGINDGTTKLPQGITTPAAPLQTQTPGSAYVPNQPHIGLSASEMARGASVATPQVGVPGQFSVNSLPAGFASYQNRDGGWTVIGPDGKPQRFASDQDAAAWMNGGGVAPHAPTTPANFAAAGATPGAAPAWDPNQSKGANLRTRDEAETAAAVGPAPENPRGKGMGTPRPRASAAAGPEAPLNIWQRMARNATSMPAGTTGRFGEPSVAMNAPAPTPRPAPVTAQTPDAQRPSRFSQQEYDAGLLPSPQQVMNAPAPTPVPNLRPPATRPELMQADAMASAFNPFRSTSRSPVFSY